MNGWNGGQRNVKFWNVCRFYRDRRRVNLITLTGTSINLSLSLLRTPSPLLRVQSRQFLSFFFAAITFTPNISIGVHDALIPKPEKHWLQFLHRRLVDPHASRRWPRYTYTHPDTEFRE